MQDHRLVGDRDRAHPVTGFFGQNVPYPGFGETSGFLASALIMLIIAASLYIVFKRKKWL